MVVILDIFSGLKVVTGTVIVRHMVGYTSLKINATCKNMLHDNDCEYNLGFYWEKVVLLLA